MGAVILDYLPLLWAVCFIGRAALVIATRRRVRDILEGVWWLAVGGVSVVWFYRHLGEME